MPDTRPDAKKCPFCGEMIKAEAIKCRFCGEFLQAAPASDPLTAANPDATDPRAAAAAAAPAAAGAAPQDAGNVDLSVDAYDLWHGGPSAAALAGPGLARLGVLAAAWAVAIYVVFWTQADGWLNTALLIAAGSLTAVFGVSLLAKFLCLRSTAYRLTSDRIEWERGVFSRRVDNINLFQVKDLTLSSSFAERLLGIGTITLITDDVTNPTFQLVHVRQPHAVYDLIKKEAVRAGRRRGVVHLES